MNTPDSLDLPILIGKFREYLLKPEGKYYVSCLRDTEPKEISKTLAKLENLSKNSNEFVDLVLYGLLPYRRTKYEKLGGVFPVYPTLKQFFAKLNYTDDQWRQLAKTIYHFVIGVKNNPNNLDSYIKDFKSNELSRNIQSGALSPVFYALNPLNPSFPLVNSKITKAYREIAPTILGHRDSLSGFLAKYLSDAAKLDNLRNSLIDDYQFTMATYTEIFYLFLFWVATYVKIEGTKLTFKPLTKQDFFIEPIDEDKIENFTEIAEGTTPTGYAVLTLKKMDDLGKIIYDTEFQRGEVWNRSKQQKLIDSILRGYNINTIFLRHRPDGKLECLDGQQRLKTILKKFLENKFPINPKITPEFNKPTYFNELPEVLSMRVRGYMIYAVEMHSIDDAETCRIFLRLQEGLPLNGAEKLNAMLGEVRDKIASLSQLPFVTKLGITDHRFAHRYILGQAFLLTAKNELTDVKFKNLEELYTKFDVSKIDSVASRLKKVLRLLDKEFGDDASVVRFNADFVSLFLLAKHISDNYVTGTQELSLKDFFLSFLKKVGEVESSANPEDAPYYDYMTYRRTTSDAKQSIEKRFEVLVPKFLEYNPSLVPKDPNRLFDYWEKVAVYHRDQGTCMKCQKQAAFTEGVVDHKIPHSKGGPTVIENGEWLCKVCNLEKSGKMPQMN